MPRFRNMRERVEFAYEECNVDIYYEGNYYFTIFNHSNKMYIEMLTEEQLDHELERIYMSATMTTQVARSHV